MNEEQKRTIARLIAGIVVADDDLDPAEDAFVDKMLAELGIPDGERAILFPILDRDEAVEEFSSLPGPLKEEALMSVVAAAASDGQIVEIEREYLKVLATVVGWSESELTQRCNAALAAATPDDI